MRMTAPRAKNCYWCGAIKVKARSKDWIACKGGRFKHYFGKKSHV